MANAMSAARPDEFGAYPGGYYGPFVACREDSNAAQPDNCGGGNGSLCALVDRVEEIIGEENQTRFLDSLVSALRRKGLWQTARRAQEKAEKLQSQTGRQPPWRFGWSDLKQVPDLVTRCKSERADLLLQGAEKMISGDPLEEGNWVLAAQLAFTKARIGNREGAKALADRMLLATKPVPEERHDHKKIMRRLAMAYAELNNFDEALRLLPPDDTDVRNYIIQIAAHRGRLDIATQLSGTTPAGDDRLNGCRILVLKAFIDSGRSEDANRWAAKWKLVSNSDKSALGIPSLAEIYAKNSPEAVHEFLRLVRPSTFYGLSLAKVAALALARNDPIAARNYLHAADPKANPNGIAIVAALAGNPDGAKAAIDANYLDGLGWAHHAGSFSDPAYATLTEAWAGIAQAYWKQGRQEDAEAVLDGAVSHIKAHWCPTPLWCGQRLYPLANAYAGINQPARGLALIQDYPSEPNDFRRPSKYFLWTATGKALILADKIEESFKILEALGPGNKNFQFYFVTSTIESDNGFPAAQPLSNAFFDERILY
jgi:tetratricopeptide (TPR) repeat protein